jgi:hypothetical protein
VKRTARGREEEGMSERVTIRQESQPAPPSSPFTFHLLPVVGRRS